MGQESLGVQPSERDIDPAEAFAVLGREVALLRRAVEALSAAREIPDYAPTLTRTEQLLASLADQMEAVAESPTLAMTPAAMAAKIVNAAHSARLDDQRLINEARAAFDQATGEIANHLALARLRGLQNRLLYLSGGGGLVAGALLWAVIPGPIARAIPRAWHWSEHRGAPTTGKTMWAAGQNLLLSVDPDTSQVVLLDGAAVRSGQGTIERCRMTGVPTKQATCSPIVDRTAP